MWHFFGVEDNVEDLVHLLHHRLRRGSVLGVRVPALQYHVGVNTVTLTLESVRQLKISLLILVWALTKFLTLQNSTYGILAYTWMSPGLFWLHYTLINSNMRLKRGKIVARGLCVKHSLIPKDLQVNPMAWEAHPL